METHEEQLDFVKSRIAAIPERYDMIIRNIRAWALKCSTFLSSVDHVSRALRGQGITIADVFANEIPRVLGSRKRRENETFGEMNVREIMTSLQSVIRDYKKVGVCDAFIGLIAGREASGPYEDINYTWVAEVRKMLQDYIGGWDFDEWYSAVPDDEKTASLPSPCSLWIPYQLHASHIFLVPNAKWDGYLQNNIRTAECVSVSDGKSFTMDDLTEPLSKQENLLINQAENENNVLPYITGRQCMSPKATGASAVLKKRHCILNIANTSGTTLIFVLFSKYFKDVNPCIVVLACIVWMVPHDHSLHEICVAARIAKVPEFLEYDYSMNRINFLESILNKLHF
jgi:hypothetical protein